MKPFFNELFDYNFYCNKKIIEHCIGMDKSLDKSEKLFSHVLNAHHIWNARIVGNVPEYEVWQRHPLENWGDIHYENQRTSFEITTNAEDFEKRIDYDNSEGRLFTNTLQDMLFHIINHSTNHRGQIASDFRNNGIEPIVLDYVYYKR